MTQQNKIQLFEERKVRTLWDDEVEKWYFSIVDVIEILTDSPRPRRYWNDLKKKLQDEGSELSEKIGQLKMQSTDGNVAVWKRVCNLQLLQILSTKLGATTPQRSIND